MRFIFSCIFLCLYIFSFSQSYSFTNYSIAEGLAQTQIKAITEDQNGYLWVGTLGGLSRFNGSSFYNFSTEDGLLNNRITALFPRGNELWIGHQGGISLYKGRKFKRWSFGEKWKNVSATKILYFQHRIVIATNGNGLYYLENDKLRMFPLLSDDQNRIRGMELFEGRLYLATREGLLCSEDGIDFKKLNQDVEMNLTGISFFKRNLCVSDTDGRIMKYDPTTGKFTLELDSKLEVYLNSCYMDSKGNLWSCSVRGLLFKKAAPRAKLELINEEMGLPHNPCNLVFEDHNGTIWVGSDGKGLFRFAGKQVVYYNKRNGISSELITSSIQYDKNTIIFGSYDKGLISFRNKKFQDLQLKKTIIWGGTVDENQNLWLATGDGVIKTDLKTEQDFGEDKGSPGIKATCFFKLNGKEILVGGSRGLSKIEKGEINYITTDFNATLVGTIRNIERYNNKIICASDGGLFEYKNGQFKRFLDHRLTSYSLKKDDQNNLWIGTEEGLFWSDGAQLKKVFLSDQPSSNYINFINAHKGKLYVGTNNGLYVLDQLEKKEKPQITHFGIEEGVINLETNLNSSLIDQDEVLWFGTASGLVRFNTKIINGFQTIKPFLNILNLKINFQEFNYEDFSDSTNQEGLPIELKLPYNKNNIIIELDMIQLKNFPELKHEYWLEGLDTSWNPGLSSSIIYLSNLPSGAYTLHVRARNGMGLVSKEYLLPILIRPIFYKSWWFILLCTIVSGSFIYGYFRFRINRERSKRYQESLEYKTKLLSLEQQSLNASMNRHFIFNSLNSIQYFINTQDKLSANRFLTNFAKLIRKNLDASSENNNHVSLYEEIERLKLYLSLESMRFKDRFDYEINTGNIDLELEEVPAMLFQPFVENSIIHGILPNSGKKGMIRIDLTQQGNKIIVCIEDNGIGIENSIAKKGFLSGDHKSQGMEITAKRISLLNKLSRSDYELEGPFQIEEENRSIKGTQVLIKIPCKNLAD